MSLLVSSSRSLVVPLFVRLCRPTCPGASTVLLSTPKSHSTAQQQHNTAVQRQTTEIQDQLVSAAWSLTRNPPLVRA
ncbi:uncharacterized protein LY89DRAFT_684052 [Mollisia scopiformis]|uniref:Uncharacterized protein n=1 Tax=Mollisia scopiformis TaxID=149040 RepID=A0A194XD73_MOLSC|nr:uncharacterized protein LY89DRAFT_684052 [Mollisia scopiformis]KUJ18123.1 hypothetical protein LY89DRAFT_684052 [Mollisia scopiformis]